MISAIYEFATESQTSLATEAVKQKQKQQKQKQKQKKKETFPSSSASSSAYVERFSLVRKVLFCFCFRR